MSSELFKSASDPTGVQAITHGIGHPIARTGPIQPVGGVSGGNVVSPAVLAERQRRIDAWNRGPIVVSPARVDSTLYTASPATTFRRSDGKHVLVSGTGTSAVGEPAGLLPGRPLTDGTATVYDTGFQKNANDVGAPTVTPSTAAEIAAVGLTLTAAGDFAPVNAGPLALVSSADALVYNESNFYPGSIGFCFGTTAGNSGPNNATNLPIPLPVAGFGYSTAFVEMDVYVEDSRFAIVSGNFGATHYVLIDGQPLTAAYIANVGSLGSGPILDFGGDFKRRRVTIGKVGTSAPQIQGIAITPQGKVTPVDRTGDVMLVLGDSYNNTTLPNDTSNTSAMLKRYLGLDGLVCAAVGGSGYIVAGANTFNALNVLNAAPNRPLWSYYNPTHILINTGGNDGGQPLPSIAAAALTTWRRTRELFPNAKITVTEGNSAANGPALVNLQIAETIANTFALWSDDNSRLIRTMGSGNIANAWVTGSGNAGAALAAGNSSYWVSTDNVHNSLGGSRYLGQRLATAINAAWAGAY